MHNAQAECACFGFRVQSVSKPSIVIISESPPTNPFPQEREARHRLCISIVIQTWNTPMKHSNLHRTFLTIRHTSWSIHICADSRCKFWLKNPLDYLPDTSALAPRAQILIFWVFPGPTPSASKQNINPLENGLPLLIPN